MTDRIAERLLDSPGRQSILSFAYAQPGEAVGTLLERLDMGWGTLHHHLKRLEDAGLVHTRVTGRRRLVYPGPAVDSITPQEQARAILAGRTTRRVAEAVLARPGAAIEEVVAMVNESPRAVYYHVKRLVDAGLVVPDPQARYAILTPGPLLGALLAPERPLASPPARGA